MALAPVYFLVPDIGTKASAGMRRELSVLGRVRRAAGDRDHRAPSAAVFTLFTYIVPILQDLTGFTPANVTLILLMIGIALTIGITLGGKFTDRRGMRR